MLFRGILSMGILAIISNSIFASGSDNIGSSGALSSLDGGLQGTVTVQDSKTLVVTNYKLGDGAAPALYWWGSTTNDLKSGFRISQKQSNSVSSGGSLQIALDAGKTSSDFSTVGLWCERFGVNYGQATLQASGGSGTSGASGSASSSTSVASGSASSLASVAPEPTSSSAPSINSTPVTIQPVLQDPYTTARAYFFCILGLLLLESLMHLPLYLRTIFTRDPTFQISSSRHSRAYLFLLKIFTLPAPFPHIITLDLPDLLRLLALLGFNVLWGVNRNKYSSDYDLYGWLTLANGGLALLVAARTNIFAIVLRIPSSTLLFYHRWIGRATVIHATIHVANLVQSYVATGQFAIVLQTLRIQVGLMAWISLVLIALSSLNLVRRRLFEGFYYLHALFILFIIGALIHATHAPEFLVPGLVLWIVDRYIRFLHNFRHIEVISIKQYSGGLSKFKVRGVTPHHPGQLAWVQIPGASLMNWHPFTLASPPSLSKEAVFAIRGQGNYTKRVQSLVTAAEEKQTPYEMEQANAFKSSPSNLKIRVDGPYGVGKIQWGIHPITVIVAGGVGITPGVSIASHIIQKAKESAKLASVRHWNLHILWIVKAPQHVAWFEEELIQLVKTAADPSIPATLTLAIHVSGRGTWESEVNGSAIEMDSQLEAHGFLNAQNLIQQGRPDMHAYFRNLRTQYPGLDVAVSVCGPAQLVNSVKKEAVAGECNGKVTGAYSVEAEVFEL